MDKRPPGTSTKVLAGTLNSLPADYITVYTLRNDLLGSITTWSKAEFENVLAYTARLEPRFAYVILEMLINKIRTIKAIPQPHFWNQYLQYFQVYFDDVKYPRHRYMVYCWVHNIRLHACDEVAFDELGAIAQAQVRFTGESLFKDADFGAMNYEDQQTGRD